MNLLTVIFDQFDTLSKKEQLSIPERTARKFKLKKICH